MGIAILATLFFLTTVLKDTPKESLSYTEFLNRVNAGEVSTITVNNNDRTITGKLTDGKEFATTGDSKLADADIKVLTDKKVDVKFSTPTPSAWESILPIALPFLLIIGFFVFMQRKAQGQMSSVMQIGRSRAKAYSADKPSTLFADVAGYEGVKQEITEVVDFLKMPEKFRAIGARIPKGVLLVGPPGTGKTLIARAVAGEAGVPFLSVSGSDFMEMFVGVGASRVRDLFAQARKLGKAIIFIDEIDSIGRKRGAGLGGGHDEREQTLNQMLSEMDGFEATEGIVMLAATNRPDILDPALLRPGRFDRQVIVPLPESSERLAILQVHSKGKALADDVDLDVMAKGTPGMSGADLSNLMNEAALFAVRRGSTVIQRIDFESARDRIMMGASRESLILSLEERRETAYHEGGHALLAAVLPNANPVHKVTIIPRGMALGVTQTIPVERHSHSKEDLLDNICMTMGGRVAEELIFNRRTTGASNDLEVATKLARRMVREWGMSDTIGPMAWETQQHVFLGEDLMGGARDYSDETARLIDAEVAGLLREQETRAMAKLREHRKALELIAEALLERETIDGNEVTQLIQQAMTPNPSAQVQAPTPA